MLITQKRKETIVVVASRSSIIDEPEESLWANQLVNPEKAIKLYAMEEIDTKCPGDS